MGSLSEIGNVHCVNPQPVFSPTPQPPTRDHQNGTGKLLGDQFAPFLRELFPNELNAFIRLDELIRALRAYIVLDDYIFDHTISTAEQVCVNGECQKHLEAAKSILCANGFDNSLIEFGRRKIEESKNHFDTCRPIRSVVDKCWYVFLPFELIPLRPRKHESARAFVRDYLVLLQLFDDFQDIQEDRIAPVNHNLFAMNVGLADIPAVQLQAVILPSLVHFARTQFDKWRPIASRSTIAAGFIRFAEKYVEEIENCMPAIGVAVEFIDSECANTGRIFNSVNKVDELRSAALSAVYGSNWQNVISMVRAEALHQSDQLVAA